ncbi:MAG: hypothetical protein AAF845_19340 [Bacteroidota bacterium]
MAVVIGTLFNVVILNAGTAGMMFGGCLGCLFVFVGPLVTVWHYTSTYSLTIPAGAGAGLGAQTGLLSAVLSWLVTFVLRLVNVIPTAAEMQERMVREMGVDPSTIPAQDGFMSSPIGELTVGLIAGAIVGAIGGAIGAAVFKKGDASGEV